MSEKILISTFAAANVTILYHLQKPGQAPRPKPTAQASGKNPGPSPRLKPWTENEKQEQKLDAYEAELGFTPVWVDILEAIENNEELKQKLQYHIFKI